MSKPYWQGDKIRLRAIEPADGEIHYEWNQEADMSRRLDYVWPPSSHESTRRWAEERSREQPKNDRYELIIETLDGEHVGLIASHSCEPRVGTFKYAIAVRGDHKRKGYASEAIRLLLRYFFEELRYQKVTVHVYSFNEPSLNLHDSLGFVREGRLRRMVYTGGQHHDEIVFGMTAEEFASNAKMKS